MGITLLHPSYTLPANFWGVIPVETARAGVGAGFKPALARFSPPQGKTKETRD